MSAYLWEVGPTQYKTVGIADALKVWTYQRASGSDAVADQEAHNGVLHPENCENDAAFIFWVHFNLCVSIGRPWNPVRWPEYHSWPAFVRDFYDAVWAEFEWDWEDGEP
jgi:hypothetical protein